MILALSFTEVKKTVKPIILDICLNEQESDVDLDSVTLEFYANVEVDTLIDTNDIPLIESQNLISINQNDISILDISNVIHDNVPTPIISHSGIDTLSPKRQSKGSTKALSNIKEFHKRLSKNKGKSGEIQISAIWDNINDIDLHVYISDVNKNYISKIDWTSKIDRFGGILDIDMNSVYSAQSQTPIENILWKKKSPNGTFAVYVNHFKCYDLRNQNTPVKIMIKTKNFTKVVDVIAKFGGGPVLVDVFEN